ncbi:hypothetical protein CC86DRAFT_373263 [Ophiobolus disseminans]|uniref:Uncharacterized protein n=1 Tax=Ophiobolus disseminans TaxID=1469910 RepID=A0A6A6ZP64_9PLEO|nr:hypothetical protein CC86DRAFT_373263 [Ophiobolus disseminans]
MANTANTPVKQEQPGQEPTKPALAPVVGGRSVDGLQSMMNLLLMQSGRFIKEHQSGGGTGRQKQQFRSAVPVATERFQDALDELENEVRSAQTVLRRDLALLRQDRKKREVAAKEKEAEKARLAAESRTLGSAVKVEEVRVDKVSTPAEPEAPTEPEPEVQDQIDGSLKREDEKVVPPIETSVTQLPERDPLFDGTPTTANPQENDFDFDAIFGDTMDTSGDNPNPDDMMDTSGDLGFNFDNNESPSLLRGLEDFAKSGDDDTAAQNPPNMDMDITMGDLPDLNTAAEVAAPVEQPAPPKAAEVPVAQPPTETANNDATNTTMNNDTTADDMMGGMVTDNLDDLFNMDEYENPENSSFDDAFFNFE